MNAAELSCSASSCPHATTEALQASFWRRSSAFIILVFELTSLQRAPALLDTYTLGLFAKFLPTDPAVGTQSDRLLTAAEAVFTQRHKEQGTQCLQQKICLENS